MPSDPKETRTLPHGFIAVAAGVVEELQMEIDDLRAQLADADAWIAAQGPHGKKLAGGPPAVIGIYRAAAARHAARQEKPDA